MKKLVIFLLFISVFILAGCQKTPINGDLDGEWEVMEVYPDPPKWDKDLRIFYNFSRNVCQLTVYGGPFTLGNLTYGDDRMELYFPFIHSESQILQLKQYGIFTNPVSFDVYFESKTRMILSNEETTVVLRKF